jgi:hypothetical protein
VTTASLKSFLCISLFAASFAVADARHDEYSRGVELFAADRYPEAIVEFKKAYERKPRAMILFNIAQAYRKDGHFEDALVYYRRFLGEASPTEKAPVAEEAGRYVREIEENLALQRKLSAQATPVVQQPPAQPPPPEPVAPPAQPVVQKPVVVLDTPPPAKSTPVYKRWYLWTPIAVAAVGIAVGIGVGVTQHYPSTDLGIRAPVF